MREKIKVSVVMAVYNEEEYIDESITSILKQTLKNFEFIIINNGSTDKTKQKIMKHMKKDKRIILLSEKKNIGTSRAVTKGWQKARGTYIAAFCGDDISLPRRLELQATYLDNNPEIFLIGTSAIYINEKGKEKKRFRKYDNHKMLSWRLRKSCSIVFPSIMFRNKNVSLNPKVSANDYNFYYELIKRGEKITNITPFLVKHREHEESLSVYGNKKFERSTKKIKKKFAKLPDKTTIIERQWFKILLLLHYLKTRKEKKLR